MEENKPVRILLVEDEFITLATLSQTLNQLNYKVIGTAKTGDNAIAILEEGQVDLAILDINIQGDKDGIYLANLIQEKYHIPFIFLTAFGDKFTVKRAIATEPYGYLLKPFNNLDVYAAIEVALKNFAIQKKAVPSENTSMNSDVAAIDETIFIRDNYNYTSVKLSDITFVQSGKNYIDVYTKEKKYLVRSSMKDFMALLPTDHFFQVHKSFVINKGAVTKFGSGVVNLGQIEIPIGAAYKVDFLKYFKTV